jgi:predicted alpha/beta hydrolase
VPTVPADEDALTRAIVALASEYGRYGYRRVTALLQAAGWQVGRTGLSGSGVVRGSRSRKSIGYEAGCG